MQHLSADNSKVRNLLLTLSYDGSAFHGWQIQQNALSVQEVFQQALSKIVQEDYDVKGCSRTDSGVHANMYCISLKTAHQIPAVRLKAALNRFLPLTVVVNDCKEVNAGFHARYSCKSKEYIYQIWNAEVRNPFLNGYAYHYRYPLDVTMLNKACKGYIGKHNYTSFCTLDKRTPGDLTRTVMDFTVTAEGGMVTMKVEADGFLYNMVRIMVGTLLRIAQGKIPPDGIEDIINQKNRAAAGPTAPACGLYLNKVHY